MEHSRATVHELSREAPLLGQLMVLLLMLLQVVMVLRPMSTGERSCGGGRRGSTATRQVGGVGVGVVGGGGGVGIPLIVKTLRREASVEHMLAVAGRGRCRAP